MLHFVLLILKHFHEMARDGMSTTHSFTGGMKDKVAVFFVVADALSSET